MRPLPVNLELFTGPGSTPSRRRFWDNVTQAVIASQKIAGRFVTVDEHPGKGTVINVPFPERGRAPVATIGACCYNDGTCDDLTESDCNDAEGNWQGPGTTCADDPNPCRGACCTGGECSILSADDCASGGGNYLGNGSTCEGADCTVGACCFEDFCEIDTCQDCADFGGAFVGNGSVCDPNPCCSPVTLCKDQCGFAENPGFVSDPPKFYATKTVHIVRTETLGGGGQEDCASDWDETSTYTIDPTTCIETLDCSGGGTAGPDSFMWTLSDDNCIQVGGPQFSCGNSCLTPTSGGPISSTVSVETCTDHVTGGGGFHYDVTITVTTTLSDEISEISTEDLIAATIAMLTCDPALCNPAYTLNEDESCCTAHCEFQTGDPC